MTGQDAVNVAAAVRRGRRVRRRRHDQARRRRPRRRRAERQGGDRQADPVRVGRARSSTSSSASTPTAWPSAILGMGDVMSLDREGRGAVRRGRGGRARAQAAQQRVHASRTSSSQLKMVRRMGPLQSVLGMIPGVGPPAQGHEGRRARARPRRGDHPLDDARGAPPARADQGLAAAAHRARARGRTSRRSTSSSSSSTRCAS